MKKIVVKMLFIISHFVPVRKRILLESNPDLSDNTEALFNKIIEYNINDEYEIIWLLKKKESLRDIPTIDNVSGFVIEKSLLGNLKLFYLYSSCRYNFFSHIQYSKSLPKRNQKFVFLTHGVHFKKGNGRHINARKVTDIITVSDFDKFLASNVYLVEPEICRNLGYPRNDYLFDRKDLRAIFNKFEGESDEINTKRLVWLPTFRRHNSGKLNDGLKQENELDLPLINSQESLMKMNEALKKHGFVIYIKAHPAQNLDYFVDSNLSNIYIISDNSLKEFGIHLYQLLAASDGLITDYSSVFIDYLLTDKHIIFTVDDIDSYSKSPGFMLDNYLEYMTGSKVKNIDEFNKVISDFSNEQMKYSKKRNSNKELIHQNTSGNYSIEILRFFDLVK